MIIKIVKLSQSVQYSYLFKERVDNLLFYNWVQTKKKYLTACKIPELIFKLFRHFYSFSPPPLTTNTCIQRCKYAIWALLHLILMQVHRTEGIKEGMGGEGRGSKNNWKKNIQWRDELLKFQEGKKCEMEKL